MDNESDREKEVRRRLALTTLIDAHYGGVAAGFARAAGFSQSTVSYKLRGKSPVTDDFVRQVKIETGHDLDLPQAVPSVKETAAAAPSRQRGFCRVLDVVEAVGRLDDDEISTLTALVSFRLGRGDTVAPVLTAIADIVVLRDALTSQPPGVRP